MLDWGIVVAGLGVGLVVGMTGMGGGALMMPILVLIFRSEPLAAVSSDVVASLAMRPVGAWLHVRRGTANLELSKWLILGSVPSAFLGVLALRFVGSGAALGERVKLSVGVALLLVALGLVVRPRVTRRPQSGDGLLPVKVRPIPTLLIGVLGGAIVGMTSIGSGSLMMILLLILYPRLRLSELVGTDLLQAVPLIASASAGHLLFGHVDFGLTASILVGGLPGIYLGAQVSTRAPESVLQAALVVVLFATGLKMLGVATAVLGAFMVVGTIAAVAWILGLQQAERRRRESAAEPPTAS